MLDLKKSQGTRAQRFPRPAFCDSSGWGAIIRHAFAAQPPVKLVSIQCESVADTDYAGFAQTVRDHQTNDINVAFPATEAGARKQTSMAYGFIGPFVSNFLRRRGYVITRPTPIEKSQRRSYWRQWFSHDPALFADVYARNRETLKGVPNWVSADALERSLWRYGVPAEWTNQANSGAVDRTILEDAESEITSADLLAFIARHYLPRLSYLEIGVSVGKTILQIHNQVCGAALVGLDVEELNPTLQQQFDTCEVIWRADAAYPVETLSKGVAYKKASCQRLTGKGNALDYVSADQFRDDSWKRLAGRRFNLIFSDGVHSPKALQNELQFLSKYDLIDRDIFFMFWDDLWDEGMQSAFLSNAKSLCRMFNRGDEAISLYVMHGSYGLKRPMGLFSSLQ